MLMWRDTSMGEHTSFQAQAGAVSLILIWNQERGWQTRCEPFFGFWQRDLDVSDLDEAKRIATDMLRAELRKTMDTLG
jgi:hypothetical protein